MQASWSKMQTFLHCPRKYELSYIENLEKIPGTESRGRFLGSAFHKALATYLYDKFYGIDELTAIRNAVIAAVDYVEENTIANKSAYDYDSGTYLDDEKYYKMITAMLHLLPKLVEYHIPLIGIGKDYRVASLDDLFEDGDPSEPAIEFEIDIPEWRGFVDTVLVDLRTDELVAVDWKLRSKFSFDGIVAIDGQLPFYAAILNQMGVNVTRTIMWQFKNTIPKPAKINLNGKPSVQVGGTTWEYWCETLPPTIDPSDWEEELRPKMKLDEDFQRPISSVVTDFSSHLAIHSAISTVVGILSASENVADNSGVYPARLDTYACEYCDFWRLCSAPLKYGGDASDIIEMEYRSKIR